ncbi:PREDICTED: uncharacterized protein LOC102015705 [Chinchilla lanigera]|uniref:uncharacterized protein LOC102015705 n=1 Tax=Chinchilla lanigera TaxID=34839 RepID=UPI00038EA9C7|nr:PREDICTED: uncharacterized protein LOC102015705 [Chinchilla lanigera]
MRRAKGSQCISQCLGFSARPVRKRNRTCFALRTVIRPSQQAHLHHPLAARGTLDTAPGGICPALLGVPCSPSGKGKPGSLDQRGLVLGGALRVWYKGKLVTGVMEKENRQTALGLGWSRPRNAGLKGGFAAHGEGLKPGSLRSTDLGRPGGGEAWRAWPRAGLGAPLWQQHHHRPHQESGSHRAASSPSQRSDLLVPLGSPGMGCEEVRAAYPQGGMGTTSEFQILRSETTPCVSLLLRGGAPDG